MTRPLLLIGQTQTQEFCSIRGWLEAHFDLSQATDFNDLPAALDSYPIILVAMSVRHQFRQSEIEHLRKAAPLARICVIVGSWCEGETRSGTAWPGVERLYRHELIPRAISEGWAGDPRCLPPTYSTDESWLARADQAYSLGTPDSFCMVCSRDPEFRSSLANVGKRFNLNLVTMAPTDISASQDVAAVIYDADRNRPERQETLQRLSNSFPRARIVVVLEFPRHDEIREILSCGGHHVVGKPFDIVDLLTAISADTLTSDNLSRSENGFPS